jgi:hypothetical protein
MRSNYEQSKHWIHSELAKNYGHSGFNLTIGIVRVDVESVHTATTDGADSLGSLIAEFGNCVACHRN